MSVMIESLRSEIMEAQKARIDLLKWKIILIAALSAVGFGISRDTQGPVPVLLGFIPLVCAYVDVLCVHNDLRILVIARFLRTSAEAKDYEDLCQAQRRAFVLESLALVWTTVVFSLLVAVLCFVPDALGLFTQNETTNNHSELTCAVKVFIGVCSAIGLLVSISAKLFRKCRANMLSSHQPQREEER